MCRTCSGFYRQPAVYIMIRVIRRDLGVVAALPEEGSCSIRAIPSIAIAGLGLEVWGHHRVRCPRNRCIGSVLLISSSSPSLGESRFQLDGPMNKGHVSMQTPFVRAGLSAPFKVRRSNRDCLGIDGHDVT